MRLRAVKGILLATFISVGGSFAGAFFDANAGSMFSPFAAQADAVADAKRAGEGAPDEFLKAYFVAMSKVTGPKDIEPFMSEAVRAKMGPAPDEKELGPLFAEMIHSTHPAEIKIVSRKEEGERVVYDLLPVKLPKACEDMAKDATFSMTGSAILVKENGLWKIYKDYWVAESKGSNGNMRMSFGTNPDKKDDAKTNLGGGETKSEASETPASSGTEEASETPTSD